MQTAIDTYKETVNGLIKEYGDIINVPSNRMFDASELLRAHYVLTSCTDMNPAAALKQHGVSASVIHSMVGEGGTEMVRKQKRADKYQAVIEWCETHALEQITPEQVMEIGGFSYPTAIKFIGDRVDLFRKIKRGLYEARDFRAERAAAV